LHSNAQFTAGVAAGGLEGRPDMDFSTVKLPAQPTESAPDGSEVRILLSLPGGSMAHFRLAAGAVSKAVCHRSVDELWYVVAGRGEMWRRQGAREEVIALEPGVCLSIPAGTHFQFRAHGSEALAAVAVTMPPWPGADEATPVAGHYTSSPCPSPPCC